MGICLPLSWLIRDGIFGSTATAALIVLLGTKPRPCACWPHCVCYTASSLPYATLKVLASVSISWLKTRNLLSGKKRSRQQRITKVKRGHRSSNTRSLQVWMHISQSDTELTDKASAASQLAQGIPSPPSKAGIRGRLLCPPGMCMGSGIWALALMCGMYCNYWAIFLAMDAAFSESSHGFVDTWADSMSWLLWMNNAGMRGKGFNVMLIAIAFVVSPLKRWCQQAK